MIKVIKMYWAILFSDVVCMDLNPDEQYKMLFQEDRKNNVDKFKYTYLGKNYYKRTRK